jgi:hypothetical protein
MMTTEIHGRIRENDSLVDTECLLLKQRGINNQVFNSDATKTVS